MCSSMSCGGFHARFRLEKKVVLILSSLKGITSLTIKMQFFLLNSVYYLKYGRSKLTWAETPKIERESSGARN